MDNNFSLPMLITLNTLASSNDQKIIAQIYDPLSDQKLCDSQKIEPDFIHKAKQLKNAILANVDIIHQILSEIQPFKVTVYEIERSIKTLEKISINAKYFSKKVNQISVFMPSNLPLYSFILFGIVPSFMANQKLIIKPNQLMREKNTFGRICDALKINHLFQNIQIVDSETQKFTDEHVPNSDIVIFTGYNKNRDKILSLLKPGSLLIYNGSGHNPIVVGQNANIQKAAKDACYARFFNSGQDCAGPDAILVQSGIFDAFMEAYLMEVNDLKVGNYSNQNVDVGPITRKSELQKFLDFLHGVENDKIKAGGVIDMKQNILYPTVICDKLSEKSNLQEVFGPISFVYSYDKDSDVSLYFNDKNGTYTRNKMYVSLYGQNEYVESRNDIKNAKHNGIGIILRDQNVHDHEEGDKAYGGYSLGASGVFFKSNEGNFQSKALPIYVPEIIAFHVDQQLFPKNVRKSMKKTKNQKMSNIIEPFKAIVEGIFGDNLVFGFIHHQHRNQNLNVFICVQGIDLLQESNFHSCITKLNSFNGIENGSNITCDIMSLSKVHLMIDNSRRKPCYSFHAVAGPKIAVVGDKTLLSFLTSKANKILKNL